MMTDLITVEPDYDMGALFSGCDRDSPFSVLDVQIDYLKGLMNVPLRIRTVKNILLKI